MERTVVLPLLILLSLYDLAGTSKATNGRVSGRRPTSSLNGRRGDMDDTFAILNAKMSGAIDRRVPDDNRTPGHREVALASLEILLAGGRTQLTTAVPSTVTQVTHRPLPPCQNGGIRLLGSFCYCPSAFMGRYCEIYRFNSSCGRIPHGGWTYINCNSCHCVAGVLRCQPHRLPGCASTGLPIIPSTTPSKSQPRVNDEDVSFVIAAGSDDSSSATMRAPSASFVFVCLTSLHLLYRCLLRATLR
ncbi:uncharacterized protein [Diadema setosum]|uniref:uncharacterized protein n=1 Tax=Diadema setosum TaxID=31175 RepID=UPI003B3A41FB